MSSGAWMMTAVLLIAAGTLAMLIWSLLRSIQTERSKGRSLWREFSLSLVLMILFAVTWVAHLIAEWQVFTDEHPEQGVSSARGDFAAQFARSTLENRQSEFLQLFSFVVLAALYVHKRSAESKDGEENIEAQLRRIEEQLGTLPASAPTAKGEQWKLPATALEVHD